MERFPADATTMATLYEALGNVVICLSATMPPGQKQAFAAQLALAVASAERNGKTALETTLIDQHRATSA